MSKIDLENGNPEQEKLTNGKVTSEMAKANGDTSHSVCAKIDEVNLLSFVSFSWMFGYLWDSYKGRIDPNLNWSCSIFDSANVNMSRLEHLWNEELKRNPQAPSLFRVIFRFMKGRLIVSCAIFLFCLIFGFIGPTCLIRGLIAFTEKPPMQDGSINYAYGFYLVISILLVEISRVLMYGATWAVSYRTGIRVRGAVLALLYKHAINVKSLRNKSPAEIVNIFANDGQRIFDAVTFAPLVLIGPFVLVGGLIYLLRVIGALSLFGILVFFVFDVLQAFLGIVMVKCRNLAIEKTEKRMNLMGEIIKCIRVIKVNGWEDLFIKRVVEVRKDERRNIAIAGYAQSLAIASGTIVPVVATFVTVLSVVYSGADLLASDIFSAVTVFFVMLFGIRMIPYGTRYLAESKNAISKIQDILLYPKYESNFPQPNSVTSTAIVFNNSTFSWDRESSVGPTVSKKNENKSIKMSSLNGQVEQELLQDQLAEPAPCLKNITVTIHKKELIGVCGEVGSGKTALLNACVGQLIEEGGDFAISGSVALVSQHPFVCGKTTIRDNILFGQTMNSQRYYKCISAVQLSKDLESMPANELSEISESGTTLSGGQKARVSLARALYSNRDIYLLDDVFSAVDKSLAQKIFNDLKEMLAHKTCLFATSDPEYLAKCDKVIFLGQGKIIDFGTHKNLLNGQDAYRNLFNSQSQLDNVSRDRSSTQNSTESDEQPSAKYSDLPAATSNGKIVEEEEDFGLAQISPKVYLDYIRAGGGALVWFFVLLAFIVNVGSGIFSTFWLSKWLTDVHNDTVIDDGGVRNSTKSLGQDENLSFYAMVYGCSLVVLFISGLIKAMIFVKVSLHASTTLHNKMLHRVIRGVVSFFDSTPAGRILNRFSKDIDEIDVKLPFSSEALLQYMITCVGFISIIAWVFPSFLLFSLPLLLVFGMFFLCFRSGIRSLKRIENISRSPIFEQISTSLDGDG